MKKITFLFALLILFSCGNKEERVNKKTINQPLSKNEAKKKSCRIGDYILTPPDGWTFQNLDTIAYLIKDNDTAKILYSKNLNWGFKHSLYEYINSKSILTKKNTTMITYFDNLKSKYYRHNIQYKNKKNQKLYYATPINPKDGYTELFIYDKLNHNNLSVSAKNLSPEKQNQIIRFFDKIKNSPQNIHIAELKQKCNDFQFYPDNHAASKTIDTIYTQDTLKIKYTFVSSCGNGYKYDIIPSADQDSIIINKSINSTIYTRAKIQNYKIVKYEQEEMWIVADCLCESVVQIKLAGLKRNNKYKIKIN